MKVLPHVLHMFQPISKDRTVKFLYSNSTGTNLPFFYGITMKICNDQSHLLRRSSSEVVILLSDGPYMTHGWVSTAGVT